MKKIYLSLLCLVLFASCSPHLVTQGITDKTSNYIVTASGQQIDEPSVSISGNSVSANTTSYPFEDISAIKQGAAYYGVQDGLLYDGVYYGKLILLRRTEGVAIDMSTHTSHPVYSYYLQKKGQPEIRLLTNSYLIECVQDDPLALRKARAARLFGTVNFVSVLTTLSGLGCVFLPYSNPIRKPAVTVGLISMPTFLITLPIAAHKRFKAIRVYNQ